MSDAISSTCAPLTVTRTIGEFPVANRPLSNHQAELVAETGLVIHPQAWLDPKELAEFLTSGRAAMIDNQGVVLASREEETTPTDVFPVSRSFVICYPWHFLRANEQCVADLQENRIEGLIAPSAMIDGFIHLGPGSRILPGVVIDGNVVIGADCRIGPNCYIRGNTTIGDRCHIGQAVEIKNCLILPGTNIGHLSYVGDSVIGEAVNFGAGTIVSNLRHDGTNHRSMVNGVLVDTGRRKFGTIVGDRVHTGIHTSIYPGRKLWPGTTTRPGEVIDRDRIA